MTVFSGFVKTRSGRKVWIGCGTEDELHQYHINMQDDCAVGSFGYPGDLVTRPATASEIVRFKAECGYG